MLRPVDNACEDAICDRAAGSCLCCICQSYPSMVQALALKPIGPWELPWCTTHHMHPSPLLLESASGITSISLTLPDLNIPAPWLKESCYTGEKASDLL